MKDFDSRRALLTRNEFEWLLGKAKISKTYQYRIKSDIKKKIKNFTELELPLLNKRGFMPSFDLSIFTQNLRISPQINDLEFSTNSSDPQFQNQKILPL